MVALVELEEGVRMVGELLDVDPAEVRIGLPVGRRSSGRRRPDAARLAGGADDRTEGTELPPLTIEATPTFVVSTALATRDFQDVHHDRDAAVRAARRTSSSTSSPTPGWCSASSPTGPGRRRWSASIAIRLGVPCYAYDTLTFTGRVGRRRDGTTSWSSVVRPWTVARRPRHRHRAGDRCRDALPGKAAIAGIGATEFSKDSGRSELRLAAEACAPRWPTPACSRPMWTDWSRSRMDGNAEIAVARELGIPELNFFSRIHYGGGAACGDRAAGRDGGGDRRRRRRGRYRAFNERSGHRFGQVSPRPPAQSTSSGVDNGWSTTRWASPPRRRRWPWSPGGTCTTTARRARTSAGSRWPTASTPRPTRTRGSTAADHPRGAPGVALGRRAAAPARLLPGERRRGRAGRHQRRTGPRPGRSRRR